MQGQDTAPDDDDQVSVRTAGGVGALMAAGLLALLGLKRTRQQRRRRPGQRIAMPPPELQPAELELRMVEDPSGLARVDQALRNLSEHAAIHLDVEWRDLPEPAWQHQVKTAQGRLVPVSETVWMRTREVWLHAVDLRAGGRFEDFPVELRDLLLADLLRTWRRKATDASTNLELRPSDRSHSWLLFDDRPAAVTVVGTAATGRWAGLPGDGPVALILAAVMLVVTGLIATAVTSAGPAPVAYAAAVLWALGGVIVAGPGLAVGIADGSAAVLVLAAVIRRLVTAPEPLAAAFG